LPALGVKTLSNHLLDAARTFKMLQREPFLIRCCAIIDSAKVLKAGKVKAIYTVDKSWEEDVLNCFHCPISDE
jgi:hypothetical protein